MRTFIILNRNRGAGFFAYLNYVLGQFNTAHNLDLIPYVDWSEPTLEYYDAEMGHNPFDYYFIQNISKKDINVSESTYCPGQHINFPPTGKKIFRDKDLVLLFNNLINKYLKIRPEILEVLDISVTKHKTLGVHCRRSDMLRIHPENMSCTTNQDFFEKTMKVFNEGSFDRIYLATEEIELLDYFVEKLPNKIIFQDCYRIQTNDSPLTSISDRKNHNYKKGKEVLIDSLNLSNCDSLLCGISGVSYFSIFNNGLKYKNVYYNI